VNQIRNWEDNQANLTYPSLLSASGKESLGGGASVGITAKLENTKVKFADRTEATTCLVYGGNLVAVDANGNSMYPIEPSNNTTVTISQSSSPSIAESDPSNIDAQLTSTHGAGNWARRRGIFK